MNSHAWVAILPELIAAYNKTTHSTMKMTPNYASAHPDKAAALWLSMKDEAKETTKKPTFAVGDWVRISRTKGLFEKGYDVNWSRSIFKVTSVLQTTPITYHIDDWDGTTIKGSFYTEELQKVKYPDTFLVEKVIKERGKGAKHELFVKWLGYEADANSWIKASDATEV